jgi:hypothetical protein
MSAGVMDRANTRAQYGLLALPLVVIVIIGAIVLIHRSGGGSSSTPTARPVGQPVTLPIPQIPARRMIAIAERSLNREKWGHSTTRAVGSNGNVLTGDIRGGPHVQSEVDTFNGHVQRIITIGKVAYIFADAAYLQGLDHFSANDAQRAAGQWVKLVAGDAPFDTVDPNDSGEPALPVHGPYQLLGSRVHGGTQTIEIQGVGGKGQYGGRVQVYLQNTPALLPVEYDEIEHIKGVTVALSARLSDFGRRVRVSAPSSYVSYDSLAGGAEA